MDRMILEWLLEEKDPEVRLRTLKEYEKLPDDDDRVAECKKRLLQSKVYERGLKKLRTDKPWAKYDALLAFAEWGLTRADIGEDIDSEVFALIESTGFKMLCGEPLLLRNLVKLGYGQEEIVKNEIDTALGLIQEDGGFRCISTNKKINDPRKPHKSCARLTVEYLLLVAELHLQGHKAACEEALAHYFTKRNIFYRTDDMRTPMVDVMLGTFYPPDPIKIGAHQIVYALRALGCAPESEAMQAGYKVLDQHRLTNGRYVLTASKSVPAFKAGNVGEENKWVTLYAYMAQEQEKRMNRVILLEGLPGTGKTTNSYRLFEQLVRNGRDVRWLHEVSQPHPTLFFSESCLTKEEYRLFTEKHPEVAEMLNGIAEIRATTVGIDYLTVVRKMPSQESTTWYRELLQYDVMGFPLERYEPAALEKWAAFVHEALRNDTIYILDSSIFQYQIFTFLLNGAEYPRLAGFVHSVMRLLRPLHPALIYLYREKTEDSIAFMEKQRGMKDLESTWERDKERPYYRNKQQDVTAYFDFLKDYADCASGLYDEMECDKLRIEITAQTWGVYEAEMLRFLGVAHQDALSCKAKDGTYVNAATGASLSIKDGILTDPEGAKRRLSPKSPTEFFMEGLPEILCFEDDGSVKLCGQQIIPQWSETGTVYAKETKGAGSQHERKSAWPFQRFSDASFPRSNRAGASGKPAPAEESCLCQRLARGLRPERR